MHSLLKRQLKRHFGEGFTVPPLWQPFIAQVNEAYRGSDADRAMLEHSLELSSQELLDANSELRAVFQQQLHLLASALEQSTEAILITDAGVDGAGRHFLFVNPAFTRMTGYTADEVVAWDPPIMRTLRADPAEWVHLADTLKRGDTYHGQHTCYRKDGTPFVLEAQIAPIRDSSGAVTHFLGIHRDISDRKRAEAALQRANQELVEASRAAGMAEIATGVLHNVGNILNSVTVSAGVLAGTLRTSRARGLAKAAAMLQEHEGELARFLADDPKGRLLPGYLQRENAALAEEQARMLNELAHLTQCIDHIKGVVATQQSYARRLSVIEPVQICELAEDAIRMNAAVLARSGAAIVRQFAEVPVLRLDRARVLQILVNLISNAGKALEHKARGTGCITLRVEAPDDARLRISVRDDGDGIAPENLTRIFAHGFTTRKTGHGFGLHSCALAAQQLGGTLCARSDGPGQGATFTLELPMDSSR